MYYNLRSFYAAFYYHARNHINNKSIQKMKKGSKYKPGQNKGGRPKIEITDEKRRFVTDLASINCDPKLISDYLCISIKTLNRWYKREILQGEVNHKRVIHNYFNHGTS
jgi:hypothetical protein